MSITHTLVNLQVIGSEVSIEVSDNELISHSEMVPIFTKSINRPHFSALLVQQLFDEDTRVRFSVRRIAYVKVKVFTLNCFISCLDG